MDMPFSLSDVAAVTRDNNDGTFGGNGAWWIIILFLFVFMGGGFWGNRQGDYGQYATAATQQAILTTQVLPLSAVDAATTFNLTPFWRG